MISGAVVHPLRRCIREAGSKNGSRGPPRRRAGAPEAREHDGQARFFLTATLIEDTQTDVHYITYARIPATGTHHTKRSLSDQRAHALEQTQTHAHEAWATGTKVHTHPKRRRRRPYVKHRLRQPVLSSNLRLCMRPGQASAPRAGRAGPRRSAPLARRSAMDTRPCCQAPAARATTAAYTCLATARTCRSSP